VEQLMRETLGMLAPGVGLLSGLVATYVSLVNRALVAELRKELAEMETRLLLRMENLADRIAGQEEKKRGHPR
jgi:hypothetical protein